MIHNFRYIDLTSGQDGLLNGNEVAETPGSSTAGVKVYVLPYRSIVAEWKEENEYYLLCKLTKALEEKPFQSNQWAPSAGTYLRFQQCYGSEIDNLCQTLIRPPDIARDCLVFLHGPAFRKLNSVMYSYSGNTLQSFLLRDDGCIHCGAGEEPKTKISRLHAWLGAGWFSLTQRRRCAKRCCQCYEQLGHLIDDECKQLCERHLFSEIMDPAHRPSIPEIETKRRQVARLLIAYLPRFTDPPDYPGWYAYGADAETGRLPLYGPVRWDSWLDQRMSPLEQDLLFEGWLTPFTDVKTGKRTLQPASLTLLFWAARVMDLPFTESPQAFIDHHDWRGWFGGRCQWEPARLKAG